MCLGYGRESGRLETCRCRHTLRSVGVHASDGRKFERLVSMRLSSRHALQKTVLLTSVACTRAQKKQYSHSLGRRERERVLRVAGKNRVERAVLPARVILPTGDNIVVLK